MRNIKRIPFGIINISANPHERDGSTYVNLFQAAFDLNLSIRIRSDERAMIASFVPLNANEPTGVWTGEIHKFTEIQGDWENLQKRKAATDADLRQVVIPEHLRPNRETFRYFLFPREHRFVFQLRGEKRSISPVGVQTLLTGLFGERTVKEKFPLVSVIIEQEPEVLDQILNLPHLNHLMIHVKMPNPDDASPDDIKFIEELLSQQGASALDVSLDHAPGTSLKPNEQNKKIARAATSNGYVIGKGKDAANKPVEYNTSEHPVKEQFDYDKKAKLGFTEQMLGHARSMVQKIVKPQAPRIDDKTK